MIKATVKNGVIVPSDPLPEDWREGTTVDVEKSPARASACHSTDAWMGDVEQCAAMQDADSIADLDRWSAELEAACSQVDPEDVRVLRQAILEIRQQEKELARKQAARP